jgi:septal ring factor EnvC (AmiA/AmiB activator)
VKASSGCARKECDEPLAKSAARPQTIHGMKPKITVVILVLISLGLCVALIARHNKAVREKTDDETRIGSLSNNVVKTSSHLEEQRQVNMALEKDLQNRVTELIGTSNILTKVSTTLEKTVADAKLAEVTAKTELDKRAAELEKKDKQINELETQRDDLTKKMLALNTSIGSKEKQIADTEKRLADSKGENKFLIEELKRLKTEKAELERQFNDLALLREQVSKLKEEMAIIRRLEFIRLGLFGVSPKGGATALMTRTTPDTGTGTNFNLNVEIKQDGGSKVVPPVPAPAPTPAPAPAPPK